MAKGAKQTVQWTEDKNHHLGGPSKAEHRAQEDYCWALIPSEIWLLGLGFTWDLPPPFFQIFLFTMTFFKVQHISQTTKKTFLYFMHRTVSVLCLFHHFILEAHNCSGFTGSQLQKNFVSGILQVSPIVDFDATWELELILEWVKIFGAIKIRWMYFACEKDTHFGDHRKNCCGLNSAPPHLPHQIHMLKR